MESSELFLIVWATIATILAVFYRHKASHYRMAIIVQQIGFKMIGEGKAKVVVDGDNVRVMEV